MITRKIVIPIEGLTNRDYPILRDGINTQANDVNGCPIPPIPLEYDNFVNSNPKYGEIDVSFIHVPIFFTQSIENIGLFTDTDFIPSTNTSEDFDFFQRKIGVPLENYFTTESEFISGVTESKLESVQTYNQNNPYTIGLNVSANPSISFDGVLSINNDSIEYVIGGVVNTIGQYVDGTGIIYETFNYNRIVETPLGIIEIPYTTFKYKNSGFGAYNSSLSALVHQEKNLNAVQSPKVENEIFVDRGNVHAMEKHLRMAEINSVEQMVRYGNGFFNVKKS